MDYNDNNELSFWERLRYAFISLVLVVGVLTVTNILLTPVFPGMDWGDVVYSFYFEIPVFIVAWLVAPLIQQYIPLKRFRKKNWYCHLTNRSSTGRAKICVPFSSTVIFKFPLWLAEALFYFLVELHGCSESALGHDCMDAGGRTNQETESRSPYARAVRNKITPRVPVGQDTWGGLSFR